MNIRQIAVAVMETANLPSSPVTALGCFLISTALANLSKGESTSIATSFLKQLREKQNWADLKYYGIKSAWLSENPKITEGFMVEIKNAISSRIANDSDVSSEEVKFVKFAALFAANPLKSDKYIDRARTFASTVSAAFLRNYEKVVGRIVESGGTTASSKRNVADIYTELESVIQAITGKKTKSDVTTIPTEVLKSTRMNSVQNMDLVKRYKALRRQISLNYDIDFGSYISNQKDLVPVHEAYKYMKSLGYRDHKVLETDKAVPLKIGMYNGKIKYFTQSGKPLAANIPANAIAVTFPRTYNEADGTGGYVSYTTMGAVGITKVYTEQHANKATESKFSKASEVDSSIDKVVAKWKKDLTSTDTMTQMGATACMLIYLAGMRVGSRQNTAASTTGEKTFGAISLRPRHITIRPTSIILKYTGKKGVEQKHIIKVDDTTTKRLAKNLENYLKGKKGDTLVFSFKNERGTEKILTYNALTNYLKASGYPAGIHKIRHVRGTNLVIELLNKTKWSASSKAVNNLTKRQKEAEEFIIDKVISPVTALLGHKSGTGALLWRTTIKSYINPAVLIKWFADRDLRKPSWLPASASKEE